MIRVLAIGNSFSTDCTQYLFPMAKHFVIPMTVGNLYIGGCSLERHYKNLSQNLPEYEYFENGKSLGNSYTILDAIKRFEWDIVTIQQASGDSGIRESYYPYAGFLVEFIKTHAPKAKIYINQTWAYERDSAHPDFPRYNNSQELMYKMLCDCYSELSKLFDFPIIPVGDVIQGLRGTPEFDYEKTGRSLCRDGYHLDLFYGRYAASAVWLRFLTGKKIKGCTFVPDAFCMDGDKTRRHCLEVINSTVDGINV